MKDCLPILNFNFYLIYYKVIVENSGKMDGNDEKGI